MTQDIFRAAALQAMREQGVGFKDLARRLGVSKAWIHRVLTDNRKHGTKTQTIDSVCRELGITIDFTRGEK